MRAVSSLAGLWQRLQGAVTRVSVRGGIVLALMLGLALPAFFAQRANLEETRNYLYDALQDQQRLLADMLVEALRDSAIAGDPRAVSAIVSAVMLDDRVARVSVLDLNSGAYLIDRLSSPQPLPPLLTESRELRRTGDSILLVSVEISAQGIVQLLAERERSDRWRTALALLGASGFIWLFLHWRLVRPIDRLLRQSQRLALGAVTEPFVWQRGDEIGRLGQGLEHTRQALNGMIDELRRANTALSIEVEVRRRAEDELAGHAQELEQRVEERTHALTEANDKLRETLDTLARTQHELVMSERIGAMGRIVAGVAHELNTPIGNALLMVTTLRDDLARLRQSVEQPNLRKSALMQGLDEAQQALGLCQRAVEQAAELVGSFKQVVVEQHSAQRARFSLRDCLQDVAEVLAPRFALRNITVSLDVPAGLELDGYPGALGQVVSNLLINAEMHGFEGRQDGSITIRASIAEPGWVALSVSDDGRGIDPTHMGRIFDPFFTTRLGRGGTGLGLHIVYSVVTQLLGGRVRVDSQPGQGTSIVLELPQEAPLVER
ncbi:MAG: ATP-binding protein [Moraxellaceae bacterium]|nr:ATP-binding protein [Moraxellaceae bacterium]